MQRGDGGDAGAAFDEPFVRDCDIAILTEFYLVTI